MALNILSIPHSPTHQHTPYRVGYASAIIPILVSQSSLQLQLSALIPTFSQPLLHPYHHLSMHCPTATRSPYTHHQTHLTPYHHPKVYHSPLPLLYACLGCKTLFALNKNGKHQILVAFLVPHFCHEIKLFILLEVKSCTSPIYNTWKCSNSK